MALFIGPTKNDPDNSMFTDGLIHLVKYRYYSDDPVWLKQEERQRELEFQMETFSCDTCQILIPRQQTWWFQSNFYLDRCYDALPSRVTQHVHCIPCLEKRITEYSRSCVECGMPFYAIMIGSTNPYCPQCRSVHMDEAARVKRHIERAIEVKLPATLTLDEWKQTLIDFNYRCAYCLNNQFLALDHFIPLNKGGGTTARNCVPSCEYCNFSKGKYMPTRNMHPISPDAIERVRAYLATR